MFLLAGQSNMEGKGAVNTLEWLGDDPDYGHLLGEIRTEDGWRERDDVFIDFLDHHGQLTVGFGSPAGAHGQLIGPEYGFGMVVGQHFDEPVLLIKTAWGGKDVANDFRAPGSGGPGPFYTQMIERTRHVMNKVGELFPQLAHRECELAGFVWFQGWNDMVNDEKTAAYADNLAQMIRDLRSDLDAPNLPVVIGELGVDGDNPSAKMAAFRAQQRAVAELPEFAGTVRFVRTAPYWDERAHELYRQDVWKGPDKERFYRIASDRPYHYLGSGRIYYLIGHALGVELLQVLSDTDDAAAARPNVLWITIDDCGPDFACYGNELVQTPTLDRFAARGVQFESAFVTTPVCSPSRSGLITGQYPMAIGSHHHRSRRPLPEAVAPITTILRTHGYRCTSLPARRVNPDTFVQHRAPDHTGFDTLTGRLKLDFNFNRGSAGDMFEPWDPSHTDEPFFAMIDFNPQKGPASFVGPYIERTWRRIDPESVALRPYWPDTPAMRQRVARYHEAIMVLDDEIARVIEWLEHEGLLDNTYVFIWGDHGMAFFRHKQWCYDSGLRVPLLIAGPGVEPGQRDDLVSSLDLAPTTLAVCGIAPPSGMHGRNLLDAAVDPPPYVYAHRDRCDETEDRVRSIRDRRFRLIHNLQPGLPWAGRNEYTRGAFLEVALLLDGRREGALTAIQVHWLAPTKPDWELYDLDIDPLELVDLADDPAYESDLERLRHALLVWELEMDRGNPYPEPLESIVPEKARNAVRALRERAVISG